MSRTGYDPASLQRVFLFNPTLGPTEETEKEKLLFFHPNDTPLDDKISAVGLTEALISFTSTFSPDQPVETVHTERTRQAVYHCEENTWLVLVVNNPKTTRKADGKPVVEYHEEELSDCVVQAVAEELFLVFRLFNGTCAHILEDFSLKTLRHKLELFMPNYISALRFDQLDLYDALDGVSFLPVHKHIYLRIHCFVNLVENTFSQIKYSGFLYNDQLVWSGLPQDDMRLIYKYLVRRMSSLSGTGRSNGGFVTGPEDLVDADTPVNAPSVYLAKGTQRYHLVIYEYQRIKLLFLIESPSLMDLTFYRNLDQFLGKEIREVATLITQQAGRAEEQYRYLYFNSMNFAIKSSLKFKDRTTQPNRELMKVLCSIHADFVRQGETVNEVCIRTASEGWVVARRSDQREFFVVFDQKKANLLEISDEVRKLSAHFFNNIFLD